MSHMTSHASLRRTWWNAFLIVVILGSSVTMSFAFTFDQKTPGFLAWFITTVYVMDLLVNLRLPVAERPHGSEERREGVRPYLRSWFAIDLLAALPLAQMLTGLAVTQTPGSVAGFAWMAASLTPLLKLLKAPRLLSDLQERLVLYPSNLRLLGFGFWLIQAVHYVALGWIQIGAGEAGRSAGDQYIRALYWCVTTVSTIGYGDYAPDHNKNIQLIYTMAVQVFGVGMFGYIIANVSGLIANRDIAKTHFLKKMEEVNAYLDAKQVPEPLQERVREYYYHLWATRKSVAAVSVLDEMPLTVSLDILLHLNRSILEKVSLFQHASEEFVREIVQRLEATVFLPGDYIIRQGEYGDCMYFLNAGEVEVLVNDHKVAQLGAGSPFGETALIQGEKRMASIRTLTYCEAYRLGKEDFDVLRAKHPEFDAQVRQVVQERLADTHRKTHPEAPQGP